MQGAPEWFGWALFLWSVPFIWIALSMSVRRAASAGAVLGKWIGEATRTTVGTPCPLILALPLVAGAESPVRSAPERCVLTAAEIDAPPETVWPHVVHVRHASAGLLTLWSDLSIHTIHRRVLAHVERLSEHC